ncbi:MAG: SMC-Scp complex subunit ScpB [Candidatus Magasanikbacteria bacterium]|jgi:segregation and condensation protein B|nr:SMC-Scp complex subunit ScpB [Candidatus Magasanikbacteria bacterium]MBT4220821.1 SMC-Scp complex subunit ScpB [Candidatus Magasanikbacteria bacterium]MBT4350166.1 SMC-Scp complex subunit ScpB [Candidatus Magasanikbacteria bacterium]MBT4541391.1 SMC-Scp complex subunit ScpB [Candidatus Magasanikbacteria bacterium]MBT6253169.1 SMC-Scp complex subunit ScpB [Candidatus Magasanikbacteria bacterium]
MDILSHIESILFVASKPLPLTRIAKATGKQVGDICEAVENLRRKWNRDDSGIHILFEADQVQMVTNPLCSDVIEGFVKDEVAGELTRAQLETLTVVAYQGPVTRPELEQIRGVNCAIILRNLLIRGLIEETTSSEHILPVYTLSILSLRHLGISAATDLPGFTELRNHDHILASS